MTIDELLADIESDHDYSEANRVLKRLARIVRAADEMAEYMDMIDESGRSTVDYRKARDGG